MVTTNFYYEKICGEHKQTRKSQIIIPHAKHSEWMNKVISAVRLCDEKLLCQTFLENNDCSKDLFCVLDDGRTLLMEVANQLKSSGGLRITSILIDALKQHLTEEQMKVYVDHKDNQGHSLLAMAVAAKACNSLPFLISLGADVNVHWGYCSVLYVSVLQRDHGTLDALLNSPDLNVNLANIGDGDTALHVAAKINDSDSVTKLLQNGANRSLKNSNGLTPVDVALEHGNQSIADFMSNYYLDQQLEQHSFHKGDIVVIRGTKKFDRQPAIILDVRPGRNRKVMVISKNGDFVVDVFSALNLVPLNYEKMEPNLVHCGLPFQVFDKVLKVKKYVNYLNDIIDDHSNSDCEVELKLRLVGAEIYLRHGFTCMNLTSQLIHRENVNRVSHSWNGIGDWISC